MNTKQYNCVFFDLDHTLWDYESNSAEALSELYEKYSLGNLGCAAVDVFHRNFTRINNELWDQYDRGEIHRDVLRNDRFHRVLKSSGIDDYEMSLQFSADYLKESPKKKNLVPHAKDLLDYLHQKYALYVITNGFEEIQSTKIASGGITSYFKGIITSARAGYKKPEKEIFEFALRENGFSASNSIMIGDNLLTDIAGANNAAIDSVFYNPAKISHSEKVTYEIASLKELEKIL